MTYRVTNGFVGRVVPYLQVWVIQGLFAAHTLGGVKAEHLRQEVYCERVRLGKQCGERNARFDRKRSNIFLSLWKVLMSKKC